MSISARSPLAPSNQSTSNQTIGSQTIGDRSTVNVQARACIQATVRNTILKPLSLARRGTRWLMAASIAVAMLSPVPGFAQDLVPAQASQTDLDKPVDSGSLETASPDFRLDLDNPRIISPRPGRVVPFFTKKGRQRGCDYVVYSLSFGLRGSPQAFANPGFAATLERARIDFKDQLPHGLRIVGVHVSGDGTDASGGPLPGGSISTSANPNDTADVSDFRISASDLDGVGAPNERVIAFQITARIDHAAFPSPAIVDNQGLIKVTAGPGTGTIIPSQDPGKPDDGNVLTGEKTSIKIDVTKCDPPPPPPGKECFKVQRGTVDCVPGGGAFIYHMPVSAEMAGKWVQLSTTTPGITIIPDTQLVPEGGGVLDWKVVGASTGDVIRLVVTGIDTYAGPEEGWGLCCTQTIEIVIPRDQRCPPKDREPDLKVEKRAEVRRCTMGGGCDFTIRVTNVGGGPYHGKIVLDEVTLPAGSTLDSGPNAPWACAPAATPMICTHPVTTLNPGASVDLELRFKPAVGWQGRVLRNCAAYNYGASGKPLFGSQQNDRGCASIPICRRGDRDCRPQVERKVDLILKKRARTEACTADGVCTFVIDIINNGSVPHDGPLTIIDTYPGGAPASSTFGPTPPWTCGPNGPGQFRCDNAGIVLLPGASTPIFVKAVIPAGYRPGTVENCAEVKAVPGEGDLTNNRACAKQRIRHPDGGKPAMRITKVCSGSLAGAAAVTCRITVISTGTTAPTGPVRVNDSATLVAGGAPVQVQTVTPDGAEWACGPVPANVLSCQIPGAVMTPGTSRHFDVTVAGNGPFENCARGSYGPAPGDDIVYPIGRACAKGGGASTIRVEKTGDAECRIGQPCSFEITIANEGESPFSGPVRIGDAIGLDGLGRLEGVAITSIEPPFGCAPEPATLPASCIADLTLAAGESHVHRVTVIIPDGGRLADLQDTVSGQNCVGVLSPDTPVRRAGDVLSRDLTGVQGDRGKAYACHPFTIKREVKRECSRGFVMNDAGNCVCPAGTIFRNGQCSSGGGTVIIPKPKDPQRCVLLKGQIRTSDGRCICPRGTELENGRCVSTDEPPERLCQLLPGQIRTQDGDCICPRGTELRADACRPIRKKPPVVEQCKLLRGQIRTKNGDCVCPRGTELKGRACVPIVKKPTVEQCTIRGQVHNKRGACVCPRGTEVIRGACRRPPVACAPGSRLINGQCLPIIKRRCPVGTVGQYPNCTPIRRTPTLQINPNLLLNPDILQRPMPKRRPPAPQ
jgi:hypothetical protein